MTFEEAKKYLEGEGYQVFTKAETLTEALFVVALAGGTARKATPINSLGAMLKAHEYEANVNYNYGIAGYDTQMLGQQELFNASAYEQQKAQFVASFPTAA